MSRTRSGVLVTATALALAAVSLAAVPATAVPDAPVGQPPGSSPVSAAVEAGKKRPKPFTVVVLPDTQHYSEQYPATYRAQTRWIAQQRNALQVRFVAHVGDLVQNWWEEGQWQVASTAQRTLGRAHIPYAVVPGNHDLQKTYESENYDQYFPPRRYRGKQWYGGYLGDSISGKKQGVGVDAVSDRGRDRLNKDSYQIIHAGGVRLLFLNLEFDVPGYALEWAQRVIDRQVRAHPRTEIVLVTHAFLDVDGSRPAEPYKRPDGTSAARVWSTLIRPNCNIHLVLSGHYHDEARRTDRNRCGQPVHQLLADFQSDPRGGNGWLRYLRFRPAKDRIDVRTYSPTLDRNQRDANSQFRLHFPMPRT